MSNLNHIGTLLSKDQTQLHLKRKNPFCHNELNQRSIIEKDMNKSKKRKKKKKRNKCLFLQKSQESPDVSTSRNLDMTVSQ
jgi:hypothetical protein